MKIGEVEKIGDREMPGYTPPAPGQNPPAERPATPQREPEKTPVKTPEREKVPA